LLVIGCQGGNAVEATFAVVLLAITPQNISLVNQQIELTVDVLNPGPDERVLAHLMYMLIFDDEVLARGRVQGIRVLLPGQVQRIRLLVSTDL
jgi:hypothetical protein